MSRPANPYDNASCESFMKTLKREEIYANEYQDLDDLRTNIEAFIEQYYNRQRLHSALGYRPPEEFEQAVESGAASTGATMSFFMHKEIFRSDVDSLHSGETVETISPAHRLDESPAGYSLAGWSPPEPASASPTEDDSGGDEAVWVAKFSEQQVCQFQIVSTEGSTRFCLILKANSIPLICGIATSVIRRSGGSDFAAFRALSGSEKECASKPWFSKNEFQG